MGVVVLAGGTGGAKLARGMLDVVGAQRLTVIANTGDDIDIYGAHVSPDVDLTCFWLADMIDARGWGIAGDSFAVMDALRALDVEVWFNLGDRDLAWCLERTRLEREGLSPTQALAELRERVGIQALVLPMCDTPFTTIVDGIGLQEFLIRRRGQGPIEQVRFETPRRPIVSPEAKAALACAEAVIVGPSNPVISIWPILTALGEDLAQVKAPQVKAPQAKAPQAKAPQAKAPQAKAPRAKAPRAKAPRAKAPIVCVSPVVRGEILKGPTAACLAAYGQPASAAGVAAFYDSVAPGLLDGIVCDEPLRDSLPSLETSTLMDGAAARAELARETLDFARSLSQSSSQ